MRPPHVNSYRFGRAVIDGQAYDRDLIILPDRVVADWWRSRGHLLQPTDLSAVMAESPEVLVVGQGSLGRMRIAPETVKALEDAGIKLIADRSGQAWKTYNDLCNESPTALAIHLTC